ncbi:D-glycero-beta-D-manno-heptose-7-phosphate kinase [Paracoccus benzoatiresistens]|uniref:Bifunctional protein HldE n=1 Tax=Paracoccus benzoatiresistens TaxID=2997341 RepID=A0ABT4J9C3_9RHOB|nr:D-glycero-beta-D-manno-heptose-7-phosphate kinase [Paracoccus sp. EF6]MCZ0963688.1 D-glycero-beta-D-manno-heptose-7-phosphate kinase [Paracoccus sp. EF6]
MSSQNTILLDSAISTFPDVRVMCVGDVIVDTYNNGSVTRISPESPIPVFNSGIEMMVPGGAANVARNVTALGGDCVMISAIGQDLVGQTLIAELSKNPKLILDVHRVAGRPTSHKIRYVAQGQHMLRVDNESSAPLDCEAEAAVLDRVLHHIHSCTVIILSDYAKGVLTDRVISEITQAARSLGKPVVVDPKSCNLSRYAGATVLTPNLKEASAAYGAPIESDEQVVAAGEELRAAAGIDNLLITRSEKGMTLVEGDGRPHTHIRNVAIEVFDVVGAGDTVVATLSLGLGSGLELADAAYLANTAGGIVVGKRGTATISPDELLERLAKINAGNRRIGAPLLLSARAAGNYAAARRAEGKQVGFTNGVFDIVHPGHISILEFSRAQCDCLIVGLNSDNSVRRLGKGPGRPINGEQDRATVLGAFGTVDAVVIFEEDTPIDLIREIRPDVLIKGADYSIETVVGSDIVLGYGGRVELARLIEGKSSTNIITRAMIGKAVTS